MLEDLRRERQYRVHRMWNVTRLTYGLVFAHRLVGCSKVPIFLVHEALPAPPGWGLNKTSYHHSETHSKHRGSVLEVLKLPQRPPLRCRMQERQHENTNSVEYISLSACSMVELKPNILGDLPMLADLRRERQYRVHRMWNVSRLRYGIVFAHRLVGCSEVAVLLVHEALLAPLEVGLRGH